MAHKKAAGSAKNLRDSNAKYRGLKLFGGQRAKAGNIIIRQKGSKYEAGPNTYVTKDFSIHAAIDGIVTFFKKKKSRFDGRKYLKTYVTIEPATEKAENDKKPKAKKAAAKKAAPKAKATTKKTEKAPAKKATAKKTTATTTTAKKTATKKAAPKKAKKETKKAE